MQTISFPEAIDQILQKDDRYHKDAYLFVKDVLEVALKQRKKNNKNASHHVSAQELLTAFQHHALKEFGPMTVTVLDFWGVRDTSDVGNMVFNLVGVGVFGKTEDDTPESFQDGFDFQDAFVKPFLPSQTLSASSREDANPRP